MTPQKNDDTGLYEVDIDGSMYEFAKWGAEGSLETLLDISGIVGRPMGLISAYVADKKGDGLNTEVTPVLIDDVVEGLTATFTTHRATLMRLFKKIGTSQVMCDGKPIKSFDLHYKDRLDHLLRVVKANLEVQYGPFLQGLAQGAGFMALAKGASSSRPTPSNAAQSFG